MGYSGSGYTTEAVNSVQNYLANRWGGIGPSVTNFMEAALINEGIVLTFTNNLNAFFKQYGDVNHLPQDMDSFMAALTTFYSLSPTGTAALKESIVDTMRQNLSLEGLDAAMIAGALNDPALQITSATFYEDAYDSAFTRFLQEFQYDGTTVSGASPTLVGTDVLVNENFFAGRFRDFFFRFASVEQSNISVNFHEVYDGFFGVGNPDFTAFLANYIKASLYPADGGGSFVPNEEIGKWLKKVQESYSIAIYGSDAPSTSSVGQTFKKVVIIDQVLRLIIKMIGTLQKVAAMQADRLRVLTLQQSAYTNLLTQVPVFTQGDTTIFAKTTLSSKDELQKARDQANNYNQTLTETIRSRRTTVQDDAKVIQSNITQSNESANDQASTATALLQMLSTILGSIFR